MKPIYEPKGLAREYGELAVNIYTGCPHRCWYCFAPGITKKEKERFHTDVRPRENIVKKISNQVKRENLTGKTIHMCFTCDPYPTGFDTTPTRDTIRVLKDAGNFVQVLTKGDGSRDFDLLGEGDWYGVTIDGSEPWDRIEKYMDAFRDAKKKGISTWVSFEPVLNSDKVLSVIRIFHELFDKVKIGKLNYYPSDIDWKRFAKDADALCKNLGVNYALKTGLKEFVEKQ